VANTVFPDSVEPAYYPNTTIFVNLLNISSSKELRDKEAGFTAIRSIELLQHIDLTLNIFDFKRLKSIHHHLFQDLYGWAGKPRSYNMRKNGNEFTPAKDLPKYEAQVFSRSIDFSNSPQRPSIDKAATKLASCLGIINTYHPFPEGNGRAQRIFISELANVFQYAINWDAVHFWEIIETSKQVHTGNYEPLENLIKRIILDESQS
jgi:cell filamentation protein